MKKLNEAIEQVAYKAVVGNREQLKKDLSYSVSYLGLELDNQRMWIKEVYDSWFEVPDDLMVDLEQKEIERAMLKAILKVIKQMEIQEPRTPD